jgi:nitrogen regulatory protein P-II 2
MTTVKLVTIIAEEVLEATLEKEILALGAKGYTVTTVRGKGEQGKRENIWEGGNIKIETIVSPEVSEKIIDHVKRKYFNQYAMVAFVSDVQVVRPHHFL